MEVTVSQDHTTALPPGRQSETFQKEKKGAWAMEAESWNQIPVLLLLSCVPLDKFTSWSLSFLICEMGTTPGLPGVLG